MSNPKTTVTGVLAIMSALMAAVAGCSEHLGELVGQDKAKKVSAGLAIAGIALSGAAAVMSKDASPGDSKEVDK